MNLKLPTCCVLLIALAFTAIGAPAPKAYGAGDAENERRLPRQTQGQIIALMAFSSAV